MCSETQSTYAINIIKYHRLFVCSYHRLVVLDVFSEEFRRGFPRELLLADDLAVVTDTEEEMQRRWLGWQIGMESKGLKVNTGKTEVMVSSRRGTKANIKDNQGTSLRQVNKFKY